MVLFFCRLCERWRVVYASVPTGAFHRGRSANLYRRSYFGAGASTQSKCRSSPSCAREACFVRVETLKWPLCLKRSIFDGHLEIPFLFSGRFRELNARIIRIEFLTNLIRREASFSALISAESICSCNKIYFANYIGTKKRKRIDLMNTFSFKNFSILKLEISK